MQTKMQLENSPKRSWPIGYPTRSDTLQGLSDFKKTSLIATLSTIFRIYLTICSAALLGSVCYLKAPALLWIPANLIALIAIARSQRALECMTHEASHYNWSRNPKLNDLLANVLSAVPVFSTVEAFRDGHLVHHHNFGMPDDPDKQRYSVLRIEDLERSSLGQFLKGILIRLPAYAFGWYKNIRLSPAIVSLGLTWHLVLLMIPLIILTNVNEALLIWAVYWLTPMTVVLTLIRFIGESGEHLYGLGANSPARRESAEPKTVFDATITNCGRLHKLVFHPVNDGYHLTHHLYPTIPYLQLGRAHRYLIDADPVKYGSRQRYRTRILQNPIQSKPDLAEKARSAVGFH
jgi:fatty acid desaturase